MIGKKLHEQVDALKATVAEQDEALTTMTEGLAAEVSAHEATKADLAEARAELEALRADIEGAPEAVTAEDHQAVVDERDQLAADLKDAQDKLSLRVLADASAGEEPVEEDGTADDGSGILAEWAKVKGTRDQLAFWNKNKADLIAAGIAK